MGPSLVGSLGSARHAGTRNFCSALAALVGLVQNFGPVKFSFSSPYMYTISLHLSPSPSKLGGQWCRIACLILSVSG
jgi:hypothetical protein